MVGGAGISRVNQSNEFIMFLQGSLSCFESVLPKKLQLPIKDILKCPAVTHSLSPINGFDSASDAAHDLDCLLVSDPVVLTGPLICLTHENYDFT